MTDNRTNEQIVAKALVAHCEDHKMPFPRGSIKKIVEALRVAGRLAGEPTEAQVEAAGAERDAALARITELEQSYRITERLYKIERQERIEAEARITELEMELEVAMRPHSECERSGAEAGERIVDLEGDLARAEARIAEAAKLHRKYTYYDLEDSCPDTTDEHREEHHHEASDNIGEFYCDQMPTGDVCCDTCRDVNGDRVDWPCPTAVSLGLNEGENDDQPA